MDCRYPEDRDVTLNVILNVWVPGFPADSRDQSDASRGLTTPRPPRLSTWV